MFMFVDMYIESLCYLHMLLLIYILVKSASSKLIFKKFLENNVDFYLPYNNFFHNFICGTFKENFLLTDKD